MLRLVIALALVLGVWNAPVHADVFVYRAWSSTGVQGYAANGPGGGTDSKAFDVAVPGGLGDLRSASGSATVFGQPDLQTYDASAVAAASGQVRVEQEGSRLVLQGELRASQRGNARARGSTYGWYDIEVTGSNGVRFSLIVDSGRWDEALDFNMGVGMITPRGSATWYPSTMGRNGSLSDPYMPFGPILLAPGRHTLMLASHLDQPIGFAVSSWEVNAYLQFDSALFLGAGSSQSVPIIGVPSGGDVPRWEFVNVPSNAWFDPPLTDAFLFETVDDAHFDKIVSLPKGFAEPFEILVGDRSLGVFTDEESIDFVRLLGAGVSSFKIKNIAPLVDSRDATAFPIQLAFDRETASFSMTPLPIPEPSTYALFSVGLFAVAVWSPLRRSRMPNHVT